MTHSSFFVSFARVAGVVVVAAFGAACADIGAPDPPKVGHLSVASVVTGVDHLSAYRVAIDGGSPKLALAGIEYTASGLSVGKHTVTLSDIPDNCTLSGANPRDVEIMPGAITPMNLAFACVAESGDAEVTVATQGLDAPGGFMARVDDGKEIPVPANGVAFIIHLAGARVITLAGLSANCSVNGAASRAVTVQTGSLTRDTVRVKFDVACVAAAGVLEISGSASGDDPDPNGFVASVDNLGPVTIPTPGVMRLNLGGGPHVVTVRDVASNCTLDAGDNPRTLTLTVGGLSRDTVRTAFSATCVRTDKIAFSRWGYDGPHIEVAYADGTNLFSVASGGSPSWSPDGKTIVFARLSCDYYYYYGCFSVGLSAIKAGGGNTADLTNGADTDPAWSPDGSKVAFVRAGKLWVVSANGSSQANIPLNDVKDLSEPAWSPDGASIAFRCEVVASWSDICVVNADGTGFKRLTMDAWYDASPAWSPDGSRIAFTTNRDEPSGVAIVGTIKTDATAFVRISFGRKPAWSPDGTRLVFVGSTGSEYGLYVVKADGTGRKRLTDNGSDDDPIWRP